MTTKNRDSMELDNRIADLSRDGLRPTQIAARLDLSIGTIDSRIRRMRCAGRLPPAKLPFHWTPDQLECLQRLLEKSLTYREISAIMGIGKNIVAGKIHRAGMASTGRWHDFPKRDVSPQAIADRERRLAVMPRDLTAEIMGDPLPGYSALDRRDA